MTTFDGTAETFRPLQPTCRVGGNACDLSAGWLDGLCLEHWSPDGDPTDEVVAGQLAEATASMELWLAPSQLSAEAPERSPGGYTVAVRSEQHGTLVAEGDAVLVVPADPAAPAVAFRPATPADGVLVASVVEVIDRDADWDREFQETVRLATTARTAPVPRRAAPRRALPVPSFLDRLRATAAYSWRVWWRERTRGSAGWESWSWQLRLFERPRALDVALGTWAAACAVAMGVFELTGHFL